MASSSKQQRTERLPNCTIDRLSPLPNDVSHRIFSHLDFLDVVRTCVLSRRWKYLWASSPYLNFSMEWFVRNNYNRQLELVDPQDQFWDFVNWTLLLRDYRSQIMKLCVSTESTMVNQFNGLLRVSAKARVRDLCIRDGDCTISPLEFPRILCESLEMLTLSFRENVPIWVATVFCNLTNLSLTRAGISHDAIKNLLSSDCTKLENVYMEDCLVKDLQEIIVSARHLKNLTIVNVCTAEERFWVVGCFDSKVRICAPNLVSFCYIGPMLRGFVFHDSVSLERATIRLLHVPPGYHVEYGNHLLCPSSVVGLNYARALTVSSLVVKQKQLCWQGRRRKVQSQSSWKSRVEDIACLSYHVKVVQISPIKEEIALELLKFLLLNGKVLEKMEILHMSAEMKRKYYGNLETPVRKASSKVVVSFLKLHPREIPWFDKGDSDPE